MKQRSLYRCTACGHTTPKWMGKCPACDTWDTFVEEVVERSKGRSASAKPAGSIAAVTSLMDVSMSDTHRLRTGNGELDRVLGGGLTAGSIVLVGGDPGMGKSTLLLQVCAAVQGAALYITGEESLQQIRQRAERLRVDGTNIFVASETRIEHVVAIIESQRPAIAVIDSVQTMMTDALESSAGSVAQVRECTALLTRIAKSTGVPVILIGHVTKDGFLAGPKVLEHMVDTVLQFEGDGMYSYRVLRALKNRYGSTNEIGVFDMTAMGLQEVPNPSEVLLSHRHEDASGTAIVALMEGTRPLLVEVQALVSPAGYAVPQRVSTGFDGKRLQMILAILEKRGGISLRQNDVFVNIAGGISVQDPAIDLGIAVALVSSARDTPVAASTVFVGELGLTGEVRHVAYAEQRVQEALRLGLTQVYVPRSSADVVSSAAPATVVGVDRVSAVLSAIF